MAVEENRLGPGEERIFAIQMLPASLDHADLRIGEVVDRFLQEIRFRNKIGIEDGDELALGRAQPVLQRARLEAGPVVPVDVVNIQPQLLQRSTAFCAILWVSSVESSSTWMSSLSRG